MKKFGKYFALLFPILYAVLAVIIMGAVNGLAC